MTVAKLTEEQVNFLKSMSTSVYDGRNTWQYIPFWFKQLDNNEYEIVSPEKLPGSVIELIEHERSVVKYEGLEDIKSNEKGHGKF